MKASRFSWMALVAATTLGPNAMAGTLRAQVRASVPLAEGGEYRLVVHSYDARTRNELDATVKPVASMQRAVTAEELERGVAVDLVEVRSKDGASSESPLVVAWIESGKADLEFDGREARPKDASIVGVSRAEGAYASVTLKSAAARASHSEARELAVRTPSRRDRSASRRRSARRDRGS